jgi:hypothetical protein
MASKSQMAQTMTLPISDNSACKPPVGPTSLKAMTYGNTLAASKARRSSSSLGNDKPTKYKDFATTQQSKRPPRIVSTISRKRGVESSSSSSSRERRKHKKDQEDAAQSSSGERTFYRERLDKLNELEHQRIHQLKQVRRKRPASKQNKQQSKGVDNSESIAKPKMAEHISMDDSRKQPKSKKKRSRKEPCKSSERVRGNSDQLEVSENTALRHNPNEAATTPKPTRSQHPNESREAEKRHRGAPRRGKKAQSQHSSRKSKGTVSKGNPKKKRPRHAGEDNHSSKDKGVKALSTERSNLQTGSEPLQEQWSYVSDMNSDCISESRGRLASLIDQFEANPSEPPSKVGSEPKDPSGHLTTIRYPSNLSCKKSQYSSKSMFGSEPKDPSGHVIPAKSPSNLSCKKSQYSNNRGTKKTKPQAKNKKKGLPRGRTLSTPQGKSRRDEQLPKAKKERKPKQKSSKKKVPSSVVASLSIESRENPDPSQSESKASSTAGSSAMFTSSCESTERFGAPLISEIERRGTKQIEKDSTKDSVQGNTSLKHHEATLNNVREEANKRIWLESLLRRHPGPHDAMETANRKDFSQRTASGSSGELSRSLELLLSHSDAGGKTKDFSFVASKRRMSSERFKARKQVDGSTRQLSGRYRTLESDIIPKNRKTKFEKAKQPWYLRTNDNSMTDDETASEHRVMYMVFFDSVDDTSTTREGSRS